jgi:hypothetical protein
LRGAFSNRLAALEQGLLASRNADGGWGYYPGKASRLEPTCWALLALEAAGGDRAVLARWPVVNGLLLERPAGSPNFGFHGVALVALHALGLDHATGTRVLVAGIQRVKGLALAPSDFNRQDNSLQAWPWVPDTFSWVEPTAWCLLALKKWRGAPGISVDRTRIETAERLLIDRAGVAGGWNYGNSNVMGAELKPYVATTALALLAMQDRRAEPAIARSLDYLEARAPKELSGLSLALAIVALDEAGRPSATVREILLRQTETSLELKNLLAIAASLYALRDEGRHAFTL